MKGWLFAAVSLFWSAFAIYLAAFRGYGEAKIMMCTTLCMFGWCGTLFLFNLFVRFNED